MFPCFIEGGAHADSAWNQAARCPLCRPRRRGRRYRRFRGASDMRGRCRAEIATVLDLADKRALSIQTLRGRIRALSQPAASKGRRSGLPRALGETAPQIFGAGQNVRWRWQAARYVSVRAECSGASSACDLSHVEGRVKPWAEPASSIASWRPSPPTSIRALACSAARWGFWRPPWRRSTSPSPRSFGHGAG